MRMTNPSTDIIATHSLDQLAGLLPEPDEATLAACSQEELHVLVEKGAQIASSRVLVDARRIYAQAFDFWQGATPSHRTLLVGFSLELLGAGVNRALALQTLLASSTDAGAATTGKRAELDHAARKAFTGAIAMRDQAVRVLRSVAGRGSSLEQKVVAVSGTAADAAALASGLDALAHVARELLAQKKGPVAMRVKLARLTPDYAARLADAAEQTRASAHAASIPRPAQGATQSELDLLDGVNLHIMADVIHAFESAHDIDPTIPRLVPISTRRLLGKRTSRKVKVASEPTAPTGSPNT